MDRVQVSIEAFIQGLNTPLSNAKVYLYDVLDNGTVLQILEIMLNSSGEAVETIELDEPGNHTLYVFLPPHDVYGTASSNNVSVIAKKLPTHVALSVSRTCLYYNETLQAYVSVHDTVRNNPVRGGDIILCIAGDNGVLVRCLKGSLNTSGKTGFTIKFNGTGNYIVYAVFAEQRMYEASRSDNVTITVLYPVNPMGGTPITMAEHYVLPLVVLIIIITAILIAPRIRRLLDKLS